MGDLKGQFAPKYEMAIFFAKGKRPLNGKREPDIMRYAKTRNKLHPTEKPLDLIKYLVSKITNEGDTVLDPFLGSGTTAVACKELNRQYIGIEIDPKYIAVAKERLHE